MRFKCTYTKTVEPNSLIPHPKNPNKHPQNQIERLAKIIDHQGQRSPIVVSNRSGHIVVGHGRLQAMRHLGWERVAVDYQDFDSDEDEYAHLCADNALGEWSDLDLSQINLDIGDMGPELDVDLLGLKSFDVEPADKYKDYEDKQSLSDRFIVPPFSVLDTKQGYWRERKDFWRSQIKDYGESREGTLSGGDNLINTINKGVSLLDPVLAEILTHWFSNPEHTILDPFAGDTVFGYVSSKMGRNFIGIELREEQAKLNNERVDGMSAKYICDDGTKLDRHVQPESVDMVFSCPPYFDLEVYSDLPDDASNQGDWDSFAAIIEEALSKAFIALKQDRFMAIVYGDVRNKKTGEYYDFGKLIKSSVKNMGGKLYNDLILLDNIGTAMLRAAKFFNGSRKVCKVHQNVAIFYKGDAKNIKDNYPEIVGDKNDW